MQSSLAWSVRAQFEELYAGASCFLTLTYEQTPKTKRGEPTLCKKHMQDFMKRLRITLERKNLGSFRSFFACGEYGSKRGRPHYHVILFGWQPPDCEFLKYSPSGYPLYISKLLDKIWSHGYCFVGLSVDGGAAGYVARYTLKKQGEKHSEEHKQAIDDGLKPVDEFFLSSRRIPYIYKGNIYYGAIGSQFVADNVETCIRGFLNDRSNPEKIHKIPRYFEKVLDKLGIDLYDLRVGRYEYAMAHVSEQSALYKSDEYLASRDLAKVYYDKRLQSLERKFEVE